VCWEPSAVESPLQPWMIDLLCSELSRSRSVSCFNLTLFQEAVQVCSGIESLWLVFGSSNKRFSGIIPQACKQYRCTPTYCTGDNMHLPQI